MSRFVIKAGDVKGYPKLVGKIEDVEQAAHLVALTMYEMVKGSKIQITVEDIEDTEETKNDD